MPRKSKAEKAKTHEALLSIAADRLRQGGYSGLNVSEVMQAAGMTHGGFYRHFKSKEDLGASATKQAFAGFITRLEQDLEAGPAPEALNRFVDRYFSVQHLQSLSTGCPVAALAGDALRCSVAERQELEVGAERLISLLDKALAQMSTGAGLTGGSLMGLLSGTLNLARLQSDSAEQVAILASARQILVSTGAISSKAPENAPP